MSATIGDTKLSGGFAWTGSSGNGKRRLLETDISASRIDFVQIKALSELLVGTDLSDTAALSDSYAIKLAADELAVEDILVHDISVDAGFVDGTLTVNALLIGDIGGARQRHPGQVEDIFGSPAASCGAPQCDDAQRVRRHHRSGRSGKRVRDG
jgi:hypothetical protein